MAKKQNKQHVIISVAITLSIAIATTIVFRAIYFHPSTTENDNAITSSESSDINSATPIDASPATPVADTTIEDGKDHSPQYEGVDPNSAEQLEATLTYYGISGADYLVNVNIAQYVSGNCTIKLGNYTGSIAIEQSAASSACSFQIPPSKLTAGQQSLTVDITAGERSGHIEEKIDVSL